MPRKLDEVLIKSAILEYTNSNLSIVECAKKHSISPTAFTRYLKKNNISTERRLKYDYNIDYFKDIDTEDKAYWLGFIAADGNIYHQQTSDHIDSYTLEISLSIRDKSHLVKFIKAIDGDIKMIKERINKASGKEYLVARVNVCSTKFCLNLLMHGIYPNKSTTYSFPTDISHSLLRHFLRGYFDGDGSICTNGCNRNGTPKWSVSLIATQDFLLNLMDYLLPLGITKVALQPRSMMSFWNKVGILQIRIFLNFLYDNSSTYLDRKYELYNYLCRLETKTAEVSR